MEQSVFGISYQDNRPLAVRHIHKREQTMVHGGHSIAAVREVFRMGYCRVITN